MGWSCQRVPEMCGDLLRAPLQVELGLHLGLQLEVRGQLGASRTSYPLADSVVGQVGVVSAVVVRSAVVPQLLTDCRRRPSERAGNLPDFQTAATQRRDSPLQQRQVTARARGLREIVRSHATVLSPPPIARLAPDPQLPARFYAARPGRQKPPVLGLWLQSALASPAVYRRTPAVRTAGPRQRPRVYGWSLTTANTMRWISAGCRVRDGS